MELLHMPAPELACGKSPFFWPIRCAIGNSSEKKAQNYWISINLPNQFYIFKAIFIQMSTCIPTLSIHRINTNDPAFDVLKSVQ